VFPSVLLFHRIRIPKMSAWHCGMEDSHILCVLCCVCCAVCCVCCVCCVLCAVCCVLCAVLCVCCAVCVLCCVCAVLCVCCAVCAVLSPLSFLHLSPATVQLHATATSHCEDEMINDRYEISMKYYYPVAHDELNVTLHTDSYSIRFKFSNIFI
jgi:hypothetical protein